MKNKSFKIYGLFLFPFCFFPILFASVPQKMNYQAVIRDSNDDLVRNQDIGIRISILHLTSDGAPVYVETQTPQTNDNGLVSLEIGGGHVIIGNFSQINWGAGPYFIKTEIDISGGTSYNIVSIQQFLSVPYALYACKTGGITDGTTLGEMLYWNGTDWVNIPPGRDGAILTLVGGIPTWKWTLTLGVNDVFNPITEQIWFNRNLGASQVAISSTDTDSYGDLYQWGRGTDGHEKCTSGTTDILSSNDYPGHGSFILTSDSPCDWRSPKNDNLWQGVNGINNPCPQGYRIPTEAEWDAERLSWGSNDIYGAFASPLKLSVAGYRYYYDGLLYDMGSLGCYWSSTIDGTHARYLTFISHGATTHSSCHASGYSVRCIKN